MTLFILQSLKYNNSKNTEKYEKLERVGCPQPQSCPPAWEQDEMLINE